MKTLKKIGLWLLVVVIVLPIIAYITIVSINNSLANKIEKNLIDYQLPVGAELVDSVSVAGKLNGSGNGMQYMGSILIKSDLSVEELKQHYGKDFEFIEVREQKSADIDFIIPKNHRFDAKIGEDANTYYSITCYDDNRQETYSDFIVGLLDFDIRGH